MLFQNLLLIQILLNFYLASKIDGIEWKGIKIHPIISNEDDDHLPVQIKKFLWQACENIGQRVQIKPFVRFATKGQIRKQFLQCVGGDSNPAIDVQFLNLRYDFYLAVQLNDPEVCRKSPDLLAAAKPCLYEPFTERPMYGKMVVCVADRRWANYGTGMDLFRHEILHALGFGTIIPLDNSKSGSASSMDWILRNGSKLERKFHYMDFAKRAMIFAQHHFKCSSIEGIEADNGNKMHLSEYIFGNELMTPVIDAGSNHFTALSGLILEDTFLGKTPWYGINWAEIWRETQEYWWGRNFGCPFFEKSCFELAENAIFPPIFCNSEELAAQIGSSKLLAKRICFSNGIVAKFRCQMMDRLKIPPSPDTISPIPLNSQYPEIRIETSLGTNCYGSEFDHNYCPIVEDLFTPSESNFQSEQKGIFVVEC